MTAGLELCGGTVTAAPLQELFDVATRAGFATVSASVGQYGAATRTGVTDADLRARIAASGTRVRYVDAAIQGLPGMPGAAVELARTEELAYRFAEVTGARLLNVAHYTGRPVAGTELADAVAGLAERAAVRGLSVVVEPIPGTGIPDLRTAVDIVSGAGVAGMGVLFDTWHHWRAGGRTADLAALPEGIVLAVQLSDMPDERVDCWLPDDPDAEARNRRWPPMTGRLLPGDGVLPLRQVVAALAGVAPQVPLGIELFNEELAREPADRFAALCAASLRALLTPDEGHARGGDGGTTA